LQSLLSVEGNNNIVIRNNFYHAVIKIAQKASAFNFLYVVKIDLFILVFKQVSPMPSILYLVPTEASHSVYAAAAEAYMARPYEARDAGFDLFSAATAPNLLTGPTKINQQVVAAYYDNARNLYRAFIMLPRSSISRTPLRLANSVGLIDAGYRGPLIAAVDGVYNVGEHERLFQIVAPDLLPWDDVRIVSAIPGGPTVRGTGGFGSTGFTGPATAAATAASTSALVSTAEEVYALENQVDISGAVHRSVDISGAEHSRGRIGSSDGW
jgi:dUTP pyrophosphatase